MKIADMTLKAQQGTWKFFVISCISRVLALLGIIQTLVSNVRRCTCVRNDITDYVETRWRFCVGITFSRLLVCEQFSMLFVLN